MKTPYCSSAIASAYEVLEENAAASRTMKARELKRLRACSLQIMNDEISERLSRLESSVAHLEYQLEQLNEVVTDQSKLITRLKKEVQRQSETIQTQELDRIRSNQQKPPHY